MDMKLSLLLAVLQCLHPLMSFCSACNLPTEDNPVSACAYCSDKHAGVRWMKHKSTQFYSEIEIAFQCRDPENGTVFTYDDCFNGQSGLPFLSTVDSGEWRWYILERELNEGTECNFTVTLSGFRNTNILNTTCTVKDCSADSSTDCLTSPIPAECPGGVAGDSVCSCSCTEGFSETRSSLTDTLLCRNTNECENKTHQIECGGVENCVDTEGGHFCNSTSTVYVQPTTTTPSLTPSAPISIMSSLSLEITTIQSVEEPSDASSHVSQSTVITVPNIAPVSESDADIRVLIIIPISVTVLIVLVLISLMFIIALNRCHNNDSVNKMITSWQNHDKFDPEFIPAVEIDKKLSMNKSLESIVAPLENISSARDEHKVLLCNGQDAVRENTLSCNMSNITHTALQPNETTDSGIISTSGQSSSNYQDYNTSPVGAYTGDLVKYSSSSSSGVESENEAKRWMHSESQEHNRLTLLIHPTQPSRSGANAACYSDNSQSWTATESGYVTEPGDTKCEYESDSQDHAEALVHPVGANAAFNSTGWTSSSEIETGDLISKSDLDFGTTEMLTHVTSMCDHVHPQCAQNSIDTSGILEQDEMNDDDDDMALTLDGSTNDHLNTNTDSIEHNIGVNERATQSQVTNENVELDYMQASRYITQTQSYGGMNTNTALMLMPDISGSSLSIMCDIES